MNLTQNPKLGFATYNLIASIAEDQYKKLKTLTFEGNKMGDQCFVILASALCYNNTVTVLNMNDNNITDSSMKVCAEMIHMASHLQALFLSWN